MDIQGRRRESTYQAVNGVHIHIVTHLVAISSDLPGKHHSDVGETVEFVVGALDEAKTVTLAAIDKVGLASSLVSRPEVAVLH